MLDLIKDPSSKKFKAVTNPEPTNIDLNDIENTKKKAKEIFEALKKIVNSWTKK